ncbi:hypothetical protein ACLKA6_010517 [Drosophila palustris]
MYDNKRVLFQHYMDVFEKQAAVQHGDPNALKQFVQTCRASVTSLEKIGVDLQRHGQILVYYMTRKLSGQLRLEWEKSTTKRELPTFEDLCAYLDIQYRTMITASFYGSDPASTKERRNTSQSDKGTTVKSSFVTRDDSSCPVCGHGNHLITDCKQFAGMGVSDRMATVRKYRLCFICLDNKHQASKCGSRRYCERCTGRHHTLIHVEKEKRTLGPPKPSEQSAQKVSTNLVNRSKEGSSTNGSNCDVLLPTAVVTVDNAEGVPLKFRAFLDQGSQASFISESAAQLLRLPRQKVYVKVNGLASSRITEVTTAMFICLKSRLDSQVKYNVQVYILPRVSHKMPDRQISEDMLPHLKNLCLADPNYFVPQGIDLLLGSDIYDELMLSEVHRGPTGAPLAQNTTLGYIVSGKISGRASPISSYTVKISRNEASNELEDLLQRFWELEQFDKESADLSEEERWCEEFFVRTHRRLPSGKYIVRLPFLTPLDSTMVLGESYRAALKRLCHLERRLRADDNLKEVYTATINEYLELGQMMPVKSSKDSCVRPEVVEGVKHCYLPHHPVIKESSSTTKVRVVFDGSMKTSNGKALNDVLAIGPKLQLDLPGVLMNWRALRFVFVADVEKMYRRINIHEDDAQYQRILWKSEEKADIDEYCCTTVMFGTSPAPFLAMRVMQQLASDEAENYPLATDVVRYQMYVDDVLSGADSLSGAEAVQGQITEMLHKGTFELRKWASNCPQLLEKIPMEHRESQGLLPFNSTETIRTLGLYWSPMEDEFRFSVNFEIPLGVPTKRIVLSTIARLFDPLGWLSPLIVTAKMLMQRLWKEGLKWDDQVSASIQKEWTKFINDLPYITEIRIPRYLNFGGTYASGQLHIFCDASAKAYGAVAYLRVQSSDHTYRSELLLAKYSMIVLSWIKGGAAKWKLFVSNRISKILETSETSQWRHVATADNPADHLSRGLSVNKLSSSELWWHGPQWLQAAESEWPTTEIDIGSTTEVSNEMKSVSSNRVSIEQMPHVNLLERYSSYTHMLRVIAYVQRFVRNCKVLRCERRTEGLSVDELSHSLRSVTRMVQLECFTADWKALQLGAAEEVMKPESRKLDLMKTGAIIKGGRMFELQRN